VCARRRAAKKRKDAYGSDECAAARSLSRRDATRRRQPREFADVERLARTTRASNGTRGTAVAIWPGVTRRRAAKEEPKQPAATPHNASRTGGAHPRGRITMSIINFVKNFAREEEGQDLLEYALLVALIALVAIGAVTAAGVKVDAIFNSIASKLPG
jgi:pilus assembly protein Flp/PilA